MKFASIISWIVLSGLSLSFHFSRRVFKDIITSSKSTQREAPVKTLLQVKHTLLVMEDRAPRFRLIYTSPEPARLALSPPHYNLISSVNLQQKIIIAISTAINCARSSVQDFSSKSIGTRYPEPRQRAERDISLTSVEASRRVYNNEV